MKRITTLLIILAVSFGGCATTTRKPQQTQLQIRQFQTRTFETDDVKMVMKALINVLQDDDYIIKDANLELGLFSAQKEVDIENAGSVLLATLAAGNNARWAKNTIIDVTANISEYGATCKVRANFQLKKMNNKGEVMKVEKITDEQHYTEFFGKVNKGIFLQDEGI